MKTAAALLPVLGLGLAAPALAQEPGAAPAPVAGRYQFQPVEGGLARLDTATGEITICRVDPARMACDAAGAPSAAPAAAGREDDAEENDPEFDRALGRMKRVFRAFGDIAREFDREEPGAVPNRT